MQIVNLLFQVPLNYNGMGQIVGLDYFALKDFCKWGGFKPLSKYVPLMNKIGNYYAKCLRG